jgi:two-component system, cell cycle sensor histidine kinase and response regulator CckA
MQQVIMNLIINAAESIGDRTGVITLRTGVMHGDQASLSGTFYDETLPEGPYVFLEVSDNGCGMSEETQKKLFDPFFTTKFTGRGLGLSAVLGIIRGHRGAIRVHSEVGKGTTFRVMYPAFDAPAKIKETTEVNVIDWRGSGTILLVDDDHAVLGLTRIMLEQMGFSVLTAIDGIEAVDIFRSQAERICLVLIDKIMPRLNGEQSFQEMRALRNDVRAILMSGYAEQSAIGQMDGKGFAGFIQKPFAIAELTTVIRTVIGQ